MKLRLQTHPQECI